MLGSCYDLPYALILLFYFSSEPWSQNGEPTILLTIYGNDRLTHKLHSFTFIISNQCNLFLIRCYRVGGKDVFFFAPQFRKCNNINFSFGPGCRWYFKPKFDRYACGSKAGNDGEMEGVGVAL